MYNDARKVLPSSVCALAFEFQGICDAKSTRGQHPRDESMMQWRLGTNIFASLSDSGVISVNDKANEHRGNHGRVDECMYSGRFSCINLAKTMTGLVELVVQFNLPTDTI